MKTRNASTSSSRTTAQVRQRIERGGERLWRYADFSDLPQAAVAQALSRLLHAGEIQRLTKGIYYRPRQTAFGPSKPNPATIRRLAASDRTLFPSGISAAGLLGFTTQQPRRGEVATTAASLPRKLLGDETVVHLRRPEAWTGLSESDAALLDFLRRRAEASELSPEDTIRRTLALIGEKGCFERLLKAAASEPPRVRAMLGAIGQQLGKPPKALQQLRASLNPLSRFDFGRLAGLAYARNWHAKERRARETV